MKKPLLIIIIVLSAILIGVPLIENHITKNNNSEYPNKPKNQEKPYSFSDNTTFHEQLDLYKTYSGQKNIVMLGTSLTYGVNWNELLNRTDIANRGIGSDITSGYLHRLYFVLNLKPKICFIEGGFNDILIQINPDTTIKNLNLVIDTLLANQITPVLTTVFYVTQHFNDAKNINKKVAAINIKITALAKQRNILLMDINPNLLDGQFMRLENANRDGLHISGKGYLIWKKGIETVLSQEKI